MSRVLAYRIGVALIALVALFVVTSLTYEIVVAARWNPLLPGEGKSRWALLQWQNSKRDLSSLLVAWDHFQSRLSYPATRTETLIRGMTALGLTVGLGAGGVVLNLVLRRPRHHGDARFGTVLDAERSRLLAKKGLILGRLGGATLVSDDPSHVLVVGPTRSGKGVSFVIPNGYMWRGSSVWFDPKRENFDAFGAYRHTLGDKVFMFSPGERDTHCYNPLDFIRRDARMPTDAAVVASFIIPEGQGSSEIWARVGRQLLTGLIGYIIASPRYEGQRHLRSVANLTATGVDFLRVLTNIRTDESAYLPSWVVQTFNQFIALEKETRNSAFFNVTAALNLWTNDLVAAATARTDFDIARLRKEPTAIFIGCSVAQLDVLRPVIKMLVQQIHDVLMASMPGPDEPHQVLVMIDEFRQLGKMDSIVGKLTVNAGYGFRMVLILQDLAQLDELYGKPTRLTTVSACQVKLFIRMNDLETSDYVSEMLGTTTIEVRTPIIRGGQGLFASRDKSVNYQERRLRLPEELRQMPSDRAIVMVPNAPGFEVRKLAYYRDSPYKAISAHLRGRRLKVPALPVWSDQPLLSMEQVQADAGPEARPNGMIELADPVPVAGTAAGSMKPPVPIRAERESDQKLAPLPELRPVVGQEPPPLQGEAGPTTGLPDETDMARTEEREPRSASVLAVPLADGSGAETVVLRPKVAGTAEEEDRASLPDLAPRTATDPADKGRPPVRFERRSGTNPIRLSDLLKAADEAIEKSETDLVPIGTGTPSVQTAVEKVQRKVREHGRSRRSA